MRFFASPPPSYVHVYANAPPFSYLPQFWHLSPDFHLAPLPLLQNTADNRFGQQKDYGEMLVGDQVRKYDTRRTHAKTPG